MEYVLTEDSRNVTCSSYSSNPLFVPSCSVNTCRGTEYVEFYRIPDNYIRTLPAYFEAYHGNLVVPANISINYSNRYNETHFAVGVYAEYHSYGASLYDYYSKPFLYNGTKIFVGSLESETIGDSTSPSSYSYLYDGDYDTGSFSGGTGGTCQWVGVAGGTGADIRELGMYFSTGGDSEVDVSFIVKDVYNKFVNNANVTLVRYQDNFTIGSEVSDLAGQVEFTLIDDVQYTINVVADGYDNYSGLVTIIDTTYNVILSSDSNSPFSSIYKYMSFLSSPSNPVNPEVVNFTFQINNTNGSLEYWGLRTTFNGTNYFYNSSNSNGGVGNLTINLSAFNTETITINYFLSLEEEGFFSYDNEYLIYDINSTDTSFNNMVSTYGSTLGVFGKLMLFSLFLLTIIIVLSLGGINPDWGAPIGIIFTNLLFLWFGWVNEVVSGMVVMVTIGYLVVKARSGV